MLKIEDPWHPSYVKHALADILIIIMCGILCGLDTLGTWWCTQKAREIFCEKHLG